MIFSRNLYILLRITMNFEKRECLLYKYYKIMIQVSHLKYYKLQNKMINHNAIFRDELKRIAAAINKKHTVLRKEIIKTSEVFENNQLPVFPYQVCFGLFKHIIEASSVTSSLIFFPFLQNLINLGFANQQMSRQIINLLTYIKSIPKFSSPQNSSKLQTIIMLLVGKHAVNLTNISYTHSIINILFSLENDKSKTLWMKTISTLDQIVLLFLNELKEDNGKDGELLVGFNRFLADMVRIAKKEQPKWLHELPEQCIVMTLLSDLLDEKYIKENFERHRGVFEHCIPFLKKNIQKISSSLILNQPHSSKQLQQKHQKPWQLTPQIQLIITMRLCLKLSKLSLSHFQLLQQTIKIISQKGSSPIKYIGYESINYLFTSATWMQTMLTSHNGDLFNFLMTTLFNNAKFILSEYKDRIDLCAEYETERHGKLFAGSFVDWFGVEMNPVIELKMIIRNIEEITFTLYSIYNQVYKISMEKAIQAQEHIPLQKTYKFCQKTVFQISKALMAKQMPEDVLQSLLKICEKFINLSGVFNDSITSTSYMKLICKYCLPSEFRNIGHRHVQINKMILNIANCLGNLFSTGCWAIVWKALQNYSIYYNRYLLGKEELQAERKSDVEILYKSMDSIFTESKKYEDEYLLKILRSLIEVTYECLENGFNQDNKKIFAFQRIEQVYRLNLYRIPIIWPELSSSLLCITTSKVLYFRLSAMSLLNTLVPITLHYIKTHPQILNQKMTQENHELLILQPWVNLSGCQFAQIKAQLAISVNKIIIDYGHILQSGWKSILQIVKKTKDIKSLQAIVETYLDKISDNIMEAINIIDEVERSLTDMNQKYLCLTQIWSIGDYCHKTEQNQALRKIYQILLQPEEMFVLGMEARHSSFYIFAEIIVHNCSQKAEQFWKWIFGQITNYYQYAMRKCLQRREQTNCEQQLKNILTNLIKIFRRLFSVSKEFKSSDLVLSELNNFYRLASDMLQFRQSEIYQMILKQTREILQLKPQESLTREEFWKFLQTLSQIYYVENDNKILKCLVTYLPNEIYEILNKAIAQLPNRLYVVYHLVEKVFLLRLEAEEKDIKLTQLRIFFEEKNFVEFFKKLQSEVLKIESPLTQTQTSFLELYQQSLIKTTHKLLLYEDFHYLQKFISFLSTILFKYAKNVNHTGAIQFFKKVIELKYEQNWIKKHSSSKDIPVWYSATQALIKVGYQYKQMKLLEPYENVYAIFMKLIQDHEKIVEKGVVKLYSAQNLPLFYQNHLQVLNFLAEGYFFNHEFNVPEQQIQSICHSIAKQASYDQKDKTNKSKNSYELLFKLSAKRSDEQIYNSDKIVNRQVIFIKGLFGRVEKSFEEYFMALKAKKSAVSSMSSSKVIEKQKQQQSIPSSNNVQKSQVQIRFILKRFLSFQLKQGILRNQKLSQFTNKYFKQEINPNCKVLNLSTAHFYFFNKSISKCIVSNNIELRQTIAQIYEKMGNFLLTLE